MKKLALITCLLLSILSTSKAKDRIIEHPSFIAWSSNNIEIDKIVISDTATVAYIKAYHRPHNWIKIAKGSFLRDNNGQLYPIRNGIGITLDEEFWMPDSGEGEFQLIFPPIPKNITSVDFSEGDFDGAYKIWGIQLDRKAFAKSQLLKDVVTTRINAKMTLPEPTHQYGKAILKGKILDYQREMFTNGKLYLNDALRGPMAEKTLTIHKDGTFYKEVYTYTVTPACIGIVQEEWIDCLLAPGETTFVTINLREISRQQSKLHLSDKPCGKKVYYTGYLASLQQELSDCKFKFRFLDEGYEQTMKNIADKTPEEYRAYMLRKMPEFRKQIAQSKCSPAWKDIQKATIELFAANTIIQTERNLKAGHITAHNLEKNDARKYFDETHLNIPKEYYQYLQEFTSLNSSKICYTYGLAELINTLTKVKDAPQIMQEGLQTDKGYLFNCIKAANIGAAIQDFRPLDKEQKAQLAKLPDAYGKMIETMNNDLLKIIEINKKKSGFTINEVDQVTNEDIFPSIISKFRGHTLLVDFWATWCGPCRMANKEILPMKEELKEKDIIYLYITGETSPMTTWQNMIPDIHGEHFRVTNEQWRYLMSSFNIEGVPTYFVVDKDGNTTFKQTGFPGVSVMKEQLMKALDK